MNYKKYSAVISCGGLGTRLNKITKNIPKALFPICGKASLERCINELQNHSINNVLISLGYKKESFVKFLDELSDKYRINIDTFIEEKPLGECGFLWKVKESLSDEFLFINGDLIFSLDFNRLINFHRRLASCLTLVTHTSDHPEDSDLVSVPNGSLIEEIYLKNSKNIKGKNAYLGNSGISIIKKDLLDKIDAPQDNILSSVFHHLVNKAFDLNLNIYSYNTTEYIKDMGTPNRFIKVEKDLILNKVHSKNYLNQQRALFLDRDNTIIECELGKYILGENDIKFMDDNIRSIKNISKDYDFVCLVTNQPSIAMGKLSMKKLDVINSIVIKYCLLKGLKIDVVTFCPHHPHKGFDKEISILKQDCFCRKPNPGLIFEQAFLRNINLRESLMIGDSENDLKAAENAGCRFINVNNL